MVSCNQVEAKTYCGTGFPLAQYRGGQLKLDWQNYKGEQLSKILVFPMPDKFDESKQYAAVFKFNSDAHIELFFRLNPRPF